MKYQAVILDFDRKTAEYVPVKKVQKRKQQAVAATRTGIAPPAKPAK